MKERKQKQKSSEIESILLGKMLTVNFREIVTRFDRQKGKEQNME